MFLFCSHVFSFSPSQSLSFSSVSFLFLLYFFFLFPGSVALSFILKKITFKTRKNLTNNKALFKMSCFVPRTIATHQPSKFRLHFFSSVFSITRALFKMSVVCKSWKFLVSDNQLWIFYLQHQRDESWDSIYFAETSLRPGYPLQ